MILDMSAIIATIVKEADAARFQNAMLVAGSLTMSALHGRFGASAVEAFEEMIAGARIEIARFDSRMAEAAFDDFRRYGKGQGHFQRS